MLKYLAQGSFIGRLRCGFNNQQWLKDILMHVLVQGGVPEVLF
jgi:hypothetical protein